MQFKALVVDDEEDYQRLIKDILKSANFTSVCVDTGKHALEELEHSKPDIVVLDLKLPDINGKEICRIIREKRNG